MELTAGVRLRLNVRGFTRRPGGAWQLAGAWRNTATGYALTSLAQWWLGTPNVSGNPSVVLPPGYIAVGTGSGTPSTADQFMFAETYGTRVVVTYNELLTSTTGLLAASWQPSATITGTWTETGMWDAAPGSAAVGSAGVSQGATTLPVASGAPAVVGGSTAGQYTTIYIADATNPEYASINASAAAGASSWTLQAALKHAHAGGTAVTVFNGNLWAHAALSPSFVVASGSAALIQWSATFAAA